MKLLSLMCNLVSQKYLSIKSLSLNYYFETRLICRNRGCQVLTEKGKSMLFQDGTDL